MSRAVISVACMGTGFFPVAKSVNTCMLPVLGQPVLVHAVADCPAAGVREIAIVTSQGEGGRQVRHYFTEDHGMRYFAARGRQTKDEPIAHLHDRADFHFIEQPRDGERYGTALPAARDAHRYGTLKPRNTKGAQQPTDDGEYQAPDALPDRPRLRWAQDQITTRPGRTGTFRRLHLIHLLASRSHSAPTWFTEAGVPDHVLRRPPTGPRK
ncbi:hypothetical protein ACN6LM_003218 [Streptomyces sp. SAS_281]|uniref:hypothetical protein n=1 Tax=Streptomyces sp. SAS_281 TaxID=3412744 RepID=UPI00403C743B